ncbi:MAG: toprim domain-containing protein [Sphingorhabdus sp.]|nr:toprim domain-containing protein [Sphingorhabdus sp.]
MMHSARIDFGALRQENSLVDVANASVKLIKSGHEFKACCPFHSDRTPSLTLYPSKAGWRWQCFGCGLGGDVIDWLAALHRLPVSDAARMLAGGNVPSVHVATPPPADKAHKGDQARKLWAEALPIAGTPAETYLRRRNIDIGLPDCLRFARLRFAGEVRPMLIAAVAGPDNRVQAVHRIVLKDDGSKADLDGGKVKFSLGPVMGGAIRLTGSANGMLVCVGIEDGLTLLQQQAQAVWAVTGDVALSAVKLPAGVRSVVVAHDNDASGKAAGKKAAGTLASEGRQVRLIRPIPPFKDFNEEITQ